MLQRFSGPSHYKYVLLLLLLLLLLSAEEELGLIGIFYGQYSYVRDC